jgi:hypothetical protein
LEIIMTSKNQAGGHNTSQGGNKSGSSTEETVKNKQTASQGSGSQQSSAKGSGNQQSGADRSQNKQSSVERSDSEQSCNQGAGKNPSNVGGR